MKGFTGIKIYDSEIPTQQVDTQNKLHHKFTLSFETINNKFPDDKIFIEDDEFIIALDGCILNSKQLINKNCCQDMESLIKKLWKSYGENIILELHGSFALVIYEKRSEKLFVTNDLLSKRPIYIYRGETFLAFSTRFENLVNLLKKYHIEITLNELAISMMLTLGIMFENTTYACEIDYLGIYQYIVNDKDHAELKQVKKNELEISTDNQNKMISELDERFDNAVRLQYQKNYNCGYNQVSTLSAGMDSRSCLLYAMRANYKDVLCLTYAESSSIDQKIAQKIASDCGYQSIFYSLDTAGFMLNVNEMGLKNEWQQAYAGSTGIYNLINIINTEKFGIIHTGLLGGELMSDVFPSPKFTHGINSHYMNFSVGNPSCITKKMVNEVKSIIEKYGSFEACFLNTHTRCCQNLIRMIENKCEAFSPFLEEDFYEYALQIPPKAKYHRKIYRQWMTKYIPNNYTTTYFNAPISTSLAYAFIIKKVNKCKKMIWEKNSFDMNPFDYWLKHNVNLSDSINKIFYEETKKINTIYPVLGKSIHQMYNTNAICRVKALTAAKAINTYF